MKKLFFAALVTIFISTTSFAANNPDNVRSFKEMNNISNSNTSVNWKYTDNFQKASVAMNGKNMEYFYSPEGEFLASSKTFDFDKLPKAALKTITNNYAYPTYTLLECIVIENADQEINYYLSMEKAGKTTILQISESGTVSNIAGLK
jgi:hypothetical protein